jgi:shikimate dehydrogenase
MSPATATRLFGVIGLPVAGNPTQEMIEAAFAAAGVDARYVSLEVEPSALGDAVRGIRALGFEGIHVTVPHKVAVVPLLDRVSEAARLAGAVNCVKRENDLLVGENTDGKGFVDSLREVLDPKDTVAVVIGAGGAARAIAAELALARASRIVIANRSVEKAADVAGTIRAQTGVTCDPSALTDLWAIPRGAQIVVQATTVGMADPSASVSVDWSQASADAIAADVVIASAPTAFLRDAKEQGHRILAGLGMLVEQAVIGFRWWIGIEPDRSAMRGALERELGTS